MDIQLILPSSCLLDASGEASKDRVAAICFGLMTFRHFEFCWIFLKGCSALITAGQCWGILLIPSASLLWKVGVVF